MSIKEGFIDFKAYKTYYRIANPDGKKTPLLLLHGGPGSTHNYFEVFDDLAERDDRPFVMYDQIGCGQSPASGGAELFNAETWLDELENLRRHLKLDDLHILGQSWGGMLAIWYAIERKPKGVKSYILSSTLSSAKLWREEQYRRIGYMPMAMQNAIQSADQTGDYEAPAYLAALDEFMRRYCCEITDESPECVKRPKLSGRESYVIGWGENEFSPTGTLSHYEFTERLSEIEQPCLVTSGQIDLSSPLIAKTMYDNLPNAKWELFAYSRHMPYVEENEKYCKVLAEWLGAND